MRDAVRYRTAIFLLAVLIASLSAPEVFAQGDKTKPVGNGQNASVGAFTVKVPNDWKAFSANETAQLRQQYIAQSQQMYRKYSGGRADRAKSVDIAAFHIAGDAGTFAIVSFAIPPQSDLINLLKNQVEDKANWGIQQGYVQKYLGLVPLDDQRFSGFYIKFIGSSGEVEISGGLEPKKLRRIRLFS